MEDRKIKVAAIQTAARPDSSKDEKMEHLLVMVEQASQDGCGIILLPELYATDYEKFYAKDNSYFALAETVPGPATQAVGELTRKYGNYVILPLFEKKAPGIYYNSAATIGPAGEVVDNYRKVQVAALQVLEKLYFRRGNSFRVVQMERTPFAKFGTIICQDRRYPEIPRIQALLGAEIMFCPTAAAGYVGGGVYWDVVNISRAVDNGMFCVYANRVGREWDKAYFGNSMIVSPRGEVLARGDNENEAILSAVLDLDEVERARIDWPMLRDLRNDLYVKYYRQPQYDEPL